MGFSILARSGLCSLMICWLLLVPAGVPVLVSLLLFSFFPQERGSVPSWFAGSSWFWLGFRCLSPFFSLLSFLRKGVLFHHDLLLPLGSGWSSGACLPSDSSLFFLSSGKWFCSIMICWFLLVLAGVLVLVSLLLSSFLPQERGAVPSWFAGSSWFRLGFGCLSPFFSLLWVRCLSPFFSLLSFFRTGVLFHHDLLVPPGSGWGSGACLPSSLFFLSSGKGFCSIMICWFLLVPAGVPVLVSLLLSSCFSQERGSVPSWFAGSSWFRLEFRCLSRFWFFSLLSFLRKVVLFHHDLLVPLGSGWGSGACLPSSLFFLSSGKGFCSIMICWFLLVPAGVRVLVSFLLSSLVPVLVSLLLSSFFSQERGFVSSWVSWFLFILAGVPVLVSLLLSSFFPQEKGYVPSWIFWFLLLRAGVPLLVSLLLPFFSQERASVPSWISWFILLPAGVPVLVSLLLSSFFSQERDSVPSWISWFLLVRAGVPVLVSLLLSSFFSQQECAREFHEFWIAHDLGGNMRCCCLGSMLVYFFQSVV